MANNVIFHSTTSGSYDDQKVKIDGNLVSSINQTVDYTSLSNDDNLPVTFSFYGDDGDNYTIKYKCTSNDANVFDAANPTDITGIITDNGVAHVTLTIPL